MTFGFKQKYVCVVERRKNHLLHVAFELMHSAFVQVSAEEGEQVWGQEERLHQRTLGQLSRHLEYYVCPEDNSNTSVNLS